MDINDWVKRTDLSSPITGLAVLLVGRDGVSPTKAIGSGVFVTDRLIMTVKHVVQGYWDFYGDPNVVLERQGKKIADFGMLAVQAPGNSAETALWEVRKLSLCPYSDLALISVEPVDELAKAQQLLRAPTMSILPPAKGEKIAAFGYASTSTLTEDGQQVKFGLNPSSSMGVVAEVYPELRDRALLSFPSFEIKTHFIDGMSGGPVFNQAGELCGLICSGYDVDPDDDPIAYGVVLWPMTGIRIDHNIPGVISPPPYTILELARAGLMNVEGWEYVEKNVEPFEETDGKKRIRLRTPR
jgi:S1-C subfamily serine protease